MGSKCSTKGESLRLYNRSMYASGSTRDVTRTSLGMLVTCVCPYYLKNIYLNTFLDNFCILKIINLEINPRRRGPMGSLEWLHVTCNKKNVDSILKAFCFLFSHKLGVPFNSRNDVKVLTGTSVTGWLWIPKLQLPRSSELFLE